MSELELVSQSICATRTKDSYGLLFVNDDNCTNPNGQFISFTQFDSPNGLNREFSNENLINSVWASPEGNYWLGDSRGNIIAPECANLPDHEPLSEEDNSMYSYQVKHTGMQSIDLIWGTSENNIWLYSSEGELTKFDGVKYTTKYLAPKLNFLSGIREDFVFAGGANSNLWFYNGKSWKRFKVDDLDEDQYLNEVYIKNEKEIYVVSNMGSILKGNPVDGFKRLDVPKYSYYDICEYQGKIYVSGGTALYELVSDSEVALVSDSICAILLINQGDCLWIITANIHETGDPMVTIMRNNDFEVYLPFHSANRREGTM
jgi:hypothetical protein